jgi:CRP-like cAMP-binding protein
MRFLRNAEIYGEDEPADYVYMVVGGAVRTYKIFGDGRRQISAFYFPGDVFGLELGADHQFSAEAIDKCLFAASIPDPEGHRTLTVLASLSMTRKSPRNSGTSR